MGIIADIAADSTRCPNCGEPLHRNYGGHELYPTLRMYDGDIVDAVVADVTCGYCGYVSEFFLWVQLPTSVNMRRMMAECEDERELRTIPRRRRFGCAPTI